MSEFSVLIGGKAGDGIDKSSLIIGHIIKQLGYRIYIYRDYPSLIRGGHTFSIIRAAQDKISSHRNTVDFILALNQDTVDFHKERLKENSVLIYNSDLIKPETLLAIKKKIGIPLEKIVKEENALSVMRNTCIIGAFGKASGISWDILEKVFKKNISREIELNLKILRKGHDAIDELTKIERLSQEILPLISGNEAIGLGLIRGGLDAYVAYPMTPSSGILHFLADTAEDFGLKVIHPESEIAVILMALGFSYMGKRAAVGTSGGGFCLMTEGLSLSGMAELPVVFIVGQRTGPSTGLPTYTGQTELHFVLNAGQGEFPRFVVAPGDAEEAYYWSANALNISWKYQVPSFILSDKTLAEGAYSSDLEAVKEIKEEARLLWDRKQPYKRYLLTETGVSPLTFAPDKDAIIKVNSYEHDEFGITIEDAKKTQEMQEKRLRKDRYLAQDLESYETVKGYGNKKSSQALICWGSNKGVCIEAAQKFNLKVIQPLVLSPFPVRKFQEALKGTKKIICVENNATGQLARHIHNLGFNADEKILKYDGRPFALDELEEELNKLIR